MIATVASTSSTSARDPDPGIEGAGTLIRMSRSRDRDHMTAVAPHSRSGVFGPSNVVFFLVDPIRSILAALLLVVRRPWLAPLLGVLAGCLTPQDISLYEEEEMINLPPVIDLLRVEPAHPLVCISGVADEPPVEFRLENVRDPNGVDGQVLSVRWFVDYSLADAGSPGGDLSNLIIRAEDIEPVEPGSDVYMPAVMSSAEIQRLLVPNATHVIEAVVSDGFDSSGLPRNRAVRDGYFSTSHKWAVYYLQDRPCD